MEMEIVPLTAEHVDKAWQRQPPITCHGIAVVEGEELLGIAAVYPDEDNRRLILVSYISPAARTTLTAVRAKRMLLKACRAGLKIAARWKAPVHAVADPNIEGSKSLLKHLGFAHFREETYAWQTSE